MVGGCSNFSTLLFKVDLKVLNLLEMTCKPLPALLGYTSSVFLVFSIFFSVLHIFYGKILSCNHSVPIFVQLIYTKFFEIAKNCQARLPSFKKIVSHMILLIISILPPFFLGMTITFEIGNFGEI